MLEIHCASCGRLLEVDSSMLGMAFACPHCGAPVHTRAASEIIDVRAEVIGNTEAASEPPPGEQRIYPPGVAPLESSPQMRGFTWIYERQAAGGPGCCTCGCLLALAGALLAIQGLYSLF